MKPILPIKRSEQLKSLSREHHDALLFIWKIRKGLRNKTGLTIIAGYINWFWENHLNHHFNDEERILLPHLAVADPLARQLKAEHESIRKFFETEWNEKSIDSFITLLNDHIRFEERQLFPYAEKVIQEKELNSIYEQLLKEAAQCKNWDNEFWKNK